MAQLDRPQSASSSRSGAGGKAAPARLLIADDQAHILEALELLLQPEGYQLHLVRSPHEALMELACERFDAVLLDMNYARDTTSGAEGLALLKEVLAADGQLPVIVMTAWGNVELAVEAMRLGARDFVQKPWENARLLTILRTQIELSLALRRARNLEAENVLLRTPNRPGFIATSPSMGPLLDTIARVGPSDANVLITGEHGTGKEVVAQTLHAVSARAKQTILAVNTGALPEGTFESELFGHVRGAFTDARTDRVGRFELADRGTLFLDEIANVPMRQQARLLRALESGQIERVGSSKSTQVDVRLLSATNANLPREVEEGRFREDLLFRLNTVEIRLPPLRERREDIPLLAAHFLAHYAARYRRQLDGLAAAALKAMIAYAWPGNVRELDHTMERAALMARGAQVELADLGLAPARATAPNGSSLDELSLDAVEAVLVRKALARVNGNITQAAELLGLSRGALYRRLEKHGIAP
jgi:DNA-binding NtrC family response regulator